MTNVVLATKVLKHTEIFQKFEPLLKWALFWQFTHTAMSSKDDNFVNKSDNDALLKIEISITISTKFTAKHNRLCRFL